MRRKIFKEIVKFFAVMFILFILTAPVLVLFGPFANLKRTVVGAILQSKHPQYITWLFSQDELDRIVGKNETSQKQELLKLTGNADGSIKLHTIEASRYRGFILEIADPKRVQVATAGQLGERGETTSNIAIDNKAIAAINAGGFYDDNGTGTGRKPYGFIIHNGNFLLGEASLPEEVNEFVGFNQEGNLLVGKYSKKELGQMGAQEGISFGPPLILNGKKMITNGDGGWGIGPRTAIGQRKDGTILFLVIDGRQPSYSLGATLRDAQDILYEEGAYTAANLDGGSSSTLYFNGEVVNKPADLLGERMIPTAFIVK
ncbi:phosphodiester glycosidase family protein [Pectinatus cerevisiiphilus]|uniref:Exopolysaccharide biosynthesis protein n=1 Tax=Pectinatus cerevisiiphilus TaxID=86956 RepID=A0A4R3K2W2_9FIRM|nr:phosphodiester glycosidase family protein [Pectinatus cerevisiiphilus]TCS76765.1 exopolysaccharide biosynthesis protein [Pectinatus cerevisiiphilus]